MEPGLADNRSAEGSGSGKWGLLELARDCELHGDAQPGQKLVISWSGWFWLQPRAPVSESEECLGQLPRDEREQRRDLSVA